MKTALVIGIWEQIICWRPYEDLNLGFRPELLFSLKPVAVPLKKALKGERRPGPLDDRDALAKSQYHASVLIGFL